VGHALVQHLALLLSLLAISGCIGATGNDRHPPPPAHRSIAYVSPTGSDSNDGEKITPFLTIAKALAGDFEKIVLLRGAHDEERIDITRSVVIEGERPVVIRGHVFVTANGVSLSHMALNGGVAAHFVDDLKVENATIAAGAKDDALAVTRSSASLAHVKLACGGMSCIQATTATVAMKNCIAVGAPDTKRVVRFETSKVRLEHVRFEQSSVGILQMSGGTLEADDVRLGGGGDGAVFTQGAKVEAKGLIVSGAAKMSLVAQRAKLRIDGSRFGATRDQTVGLSGTDAVFRSTFFEGSPNGAISVIDHLVSRALIRIEGGEIQHKQSSGLLIASGVVTIAGGTRFVGEHSKNQDDAITANGVDSRVIVESALFDSPAGFGVAFHSDAGGSVTATISGAGLGGVLVEDVAAEPILIARSVIKGCADGSGVVVHEAGMVRVDRVRVEKCKEAGVLAGEKANVAVFESTLSDNSMYGCAAFGGASVRVEKTRIKGSKFATFASCGDGARIEDEGSNRFEGAVSACP
jgi:nitrous oxidase accessory protein NosD